MPMTAWTPVPWTAQLIAAEQVAVGDELDPGAGAADLGDEVVVARAVEDDHRDVHGPPAERLGDARGRSPPAAA